MEEVKEVNEEEAYNTLKEAFFIKLGKACTQPYEWDDFLYNLHDYDAVLNEYKIKVPAGTEFRLIHAEREQVINNLRTIYGNNSSGKRQFREEDRIAYLKQEFEELKQTNAKTDEANEQLATEIFEKEEAILLNMAQLFGLQTVVASHENTMKTAVIDFNQMRANLESAIKEKEDYKTTAENMNSNASNLIQQARDELRIEKAKAASAVSEFERLKTKANDTYNRLQVEFHTQRVEAENLKIDAETEIYRLREQLSNPGTTQNDQQYLLASYLDYMLFNAPFDNGRFEHFSPYTEVIKALDAHYQLFINIIYVPHYVDGQVAINIMLRIVHVIQVREYTQYLDLLLRYAISNNAAYIYAGNPAPDVYHRHFKYLKEQVTNNRYLEFMLVNPIKDDQTRVDELGQFRDHYEVYSSVIIGEVGRECNFQNIDNTFYLREYLLFILTDIASDLVFSKFADDQRFIVKYNLHLQLLRSKLRDQIALIRVAKRFKYLNSHELEDALTRLESSAKQQPIDTPPQPTDTLPNQPPNPMKRQSVLLNQQQAEYAQEEIAAYRKFEEARKVFITNDIYANLKEPLRSRETVLYDAVKKCNTFKLNERTELQVAKIIKACQNYSGHLSKLEEKIDDEKAYAAISIVTFQSPEYKELIDKLHEDIEDVQDAIDAYITICEKHALFNAKIAASKKEVDKDEVETLKQNIVELEMLVKRLKENSQAKETASNLSLINIEPADETRFKNNAALFITKVVGEMKLDTDIVLKLIHMGLDTEFFKRLIAMHKDILFKTDGIAAMLLQQHEMTVSVLNTLKKEKQHTYDEQVCFPPVVQRSKDATRERTVLYCYDGGYLPSKALDVVRKFNICTLVCCKMHAKDVRKLEDEGVVIRRKLKEYYVDENRTRVVFTLQNGWGVKSVNSQ